MVMLSTKFRNVFSLSRSTAVSADVPTDLEFSAAVRPEEDLRFSFFCNEVMLIC